MDFLGGTGSERFDFLPYLQPGLEAYFKVVSMLVCGSHDSTLVQGGGWYSPPPLLLALTKSCPEWSHHFPLPLSLLLLGMVLLSHYSRDRSPLEG